MSRVVSKPVGGQLPGRIIWGAVVRRANYITLHHIKFRVKMPKHFSHFTDTLKFVVKINYGKDAKNK